MFLSDNCPNPAGPPDKSDYSPYQRGQDFVGQLASPLLEGHG